MASSFSVKKYLSKIHAHELIAELIRNHKAEAFFEINDQTPRKLAITLMEDSIKSLDTEKRIAVIKDLSYVASITSTHTASLGKKIATKLSGTPHEPEIECVSDHDTVLYLFLRHTDVAEKLAFLAPFYASKSYFSYEAKKVDPAEAEMRLTELSREFTRLANKDDNATEQEMEYFFLGDILYIESKFQGEYSVAPKLDASTGEIDKKHMARTLSSIRIAYLPEEEVVLIAGNVSKEIKMVFLDTFLRVVCLSGYEEKREVFSFEPLKNFSLDFTSHNKGTPFIKAWIKSVTLSYADGKKKLRLTLPSSRDMTNMQALDETLEELGLKERFVSFDIINMTFGFLFQNKEQQDKSVNVNCSLSPNKASLCPLFEYERYTKSILKNAGIYEGFRLQEEK